ncbi:MAG TPA: phospholipase [Candidatus Coprenecus stercoravium]|uniref:Phospholipase n=1 Tax=Candidatus Coprenecus stercoravium TaxID=2840735 RepID=A0A9D2GS02_9BACT|nr:phospholipase [Candidatus Coprenecus stercoravium]
MDQFTEYIANEAHYSRVIQRIPLVKHQLWIGTADIKDLYVAQGKQTVPLLAVLAGLIRRGVEIRLIHAKEPGPAFREDFDRYPELTSGLERVLCPRVHFKLMIFDLNTAYIGSANLTGAGIGMKSSLRRNFEAGILTDAPELVSAATDQFDRVWMGAHCHMCGRKAFCGDRIV